VKYVASLGPSLQMEIQGDYSGTATVPSACPGVLTDRGFGPLSVATPSGCHINSNKYLNR